MVTLQEVQASNALIPTSLPAGLVAVFVGGTSGIGEYTLKAFAKHAVKPRIYNIGRNEQAAKRIGNECRASNADVSYEFIKADTSLLRNVDAVCAQIMANQSHVNVLCLSTGMLGGMGVDTEEGLHLPCALFHHTRLRFTLNLLPLLRRAPTLRRVVSVFAGTKEGPLLSSDIQARDVSVRRIHQVRGHGAGMVTLGLEKVAEMAPEVTFVHTFPGPVRTNIGRRGQGLMVGVMCVVFDTLVMPFFAIPDDESGARHLFLATSARYGSLGGNDAAGVEMGNGVEAAVDTRGNVGGGMFVVDEKCESGDAKCRGVLEGLRSDGTKERVWEQTVGELRRVTGRVSVGEEKL